MKLNELKSHKKAILGVLIGLPVSLFSGISIPNSVLASSPNWCTKSPDRIMVGDLSEKHIVDFSSACRGHDICYWTIGANKAHCDNVFLSDLQSTCRQQSFFFDKLIKECDSQAKLYYNAVSGSGAVGVVTEGIANRSFSDAQSEANTVANQLKEKFPALDIEQYRQEIALQLATRQASGESVKKSIENTFNSISSRIPGTSKGICRQLVSGDSWYPSWQSCCDLEGDRSRWTNSSGQASDWGGSCAYWGIR